MKKIILVSIASFFCTLIYSQETITFKADLASKQFSHIKSENLITGESYNLKITGINTAFISVELSSTDYNLISSTPDILQRFLPDISNSGILEHREDTVIPKDGTVTKYSKIYEHTLEQLKKLEELAKRATLLYNESNDYAEFRTDAMVRSIRDKAKNSLRSLGQTFEKIPATIASKSDPVQELTNSIGYSVYYIESAKTFYKTLIEQQDLSMDQEVTHALLTYSSTLEVLSRYIDLKTSLKHFNFLVSSSEMQNYKEFPQAIRASKDVLETKITLINTFTNDTILSKSIDFYTKNGGFKFDFSTGFFYNNITEKSYYVENASVERNEIKEENGNDFDIAIGALAHASYQLSTGLRAGLNLGVAVSPLDGITRYLFGAGVLIGKEKLVGVNVGASLARINVLSDLTEREGGNLYVPVEITSVPTYKKSEWGLFFGLTYNLTRQRKK